MSTKKEVITLKDIVRNYRVGTETVRALRKSFTYCFIRENMWLLWVPSGSGKINTNESFRLFRYPH